jgi:hypothetical protein
MRPVLISKALRLPAAQRVKMGLVLKKSTASATKYSPRNSALGWGAGCRLTECGLEADACWSNRHGNQTHNHADDEQKAQDIEDFFVSGTSSLTHNQLTSLQRFNRHFTCQLFTIQFISHLRASHSRLSW